MLFNPVVKVETNRLREFDGLRAIIKQLPAKILLKIGYAGKRASGIFQHLCEGEIFLQAQLDKRPPRVKSQALVHLLKDPAVATDRESDFRFFGKTPDQYKPARQKERFCRSA